MKQSRILLAASLCFFLSACAGREETVYHSTPAFDPQIFFNGDLCVWGVLYDRSGNLSRKFVATIKGASDQSSFTLDERFVFDDGEQLSRLWQFKQQPTVVEQKREQNLKPATHWVGTAGDVDGEAKGLIIGDSFFLDYVLKISQGQNTPSDSANNDETLHVEMSDKLHLVDENTLIGVTQMSWWGFDAGSIHLVIQKQTSNVNQCKSKITMAKG